ncbi:hypothetical protein FJTKL_05672 [Diaporthe vaccinii]|uniref:Uncharacterized protein n=1 Tax=Diaporthe vaccinii TaxID=105482 RepID=A0ABR4DRE9_9PEZI
MCLYCEEKVLEYQACEKGLIVNRLAQEFTHLSPVSTTLQAGRPCGMQPFCGESSSSELPISIVTTLLLFNIPSHTNPLIEPLPHSIPLREDETGSHRSRVFRCPGGIPGCALPHVYLHTGSCWPPLDGALGMSK